MAPRKANCSYNEALVLRGSTVFYIFYVVNYRLSSVSDFFKLIIKGLDVKERKCKREREREREYDILN